MPIPIPISHYLVGDKQRLTIVAGPCVIESESTVLKIAEGLARYFESSPLQLIFKASYDKANRSSIRSFRGVGAAKGLKLLQRVRCEFGLPVLTDVHTPDEARAAGEVCDVIQIPAFLCRQTDLIVAAAESGAAINIKKGQFLAPWDMKAVVEKILSTSNRAILLTERGSSFGYNNLVVDFRSIAIMQQLGFPVLFDATHAVQLPGASGDSSGGERQYVALLARAALAAGADGLFVEVHPDPAHALSDRHTQIPLHWMPRLIEEWSRLFEALTVEPLCALHS